jgi:hypothetical protein
MKIKKFEALKGTYYQPGDKIIQGTLHIDFEILEEDIKEYIEEYGDIEAAINVYLQDRVTNKYYDWKLVDYQGNEIKDEELFDDTKKYNV